MSEDHRNATPLPEEHKATELTAASLRWMQDLGVVTEGLGFAMRKPTAVRPFVYEARFDLLPPGNKDMLLVLKGFGEHGGVCAFVNSNSFVTLIRNAQAALFSGKLKWYEDQYTPKNYPKRLEAYAKGQYHSR